MFVRIIRFLLGFAFFEIRSDNSERFLNICAKNNIVLWGTKRKKNYLTSNCFARDYKKLRKLRKNCNINIKVKEKKGLPFLTKRYKMRYGLVTGLVVFCLMLQMFSSSIWNIKIEGNKNLTNTQIINALKSIGIKEGDRVSTIDTNQKRLELIGKMPELSWAAINITGSTAVVDVRERVATDDNPKDTKPSNLIASQSGIIVSHKLISGNPSVIVGEAVRKGDLLVSGAITLTNGETMFCRSKGEVIAKTTHTLEYKALYNQENVVKTGEVQQKSVINFFSLNIPLFLGTVKYPHEKQVLNSSVVIENVQLPLGITTAKFYKTETKKLILNKADAKAQAIEKINEMEKTQMKDSKIISKNISVLFDQHGVKVIADYVCDENIAVNKDINISGN